MNVVCTKNWLPRFRFSFGQKSNLSTVSRKRCPSFGLDRHGSGRADRDQEIPAGTTAQTRTAAGFEISQVGMTNFCLFLSNWQKWKSERSMKTDIFRKFDFSCFRKALFQSKWTERPRSGLSLHRQIVPRRVQWNRQGTGLEGVFQMVRISCFL